MVVDLTELGQDLPYRPLEGITHVIIHRIEDADNAPELAQFFKDNPEWTGGKMPYHIVIQLDGTVQQACAFDRKAPGARAANRVGIQVAVARLTLDGRPSAAQEAALMDVCVDLCEFIGFKRAVVMGHTEFPGGSSNPKKNCPGPGIDLKALRELVQAWAQDNISPREAREIREEQGYIFERVSHDTA